MTNLHSVTDECITNLTTYANGGIEIIVIDNASDPPYKHEYATVIRNEQNIGFWPSMLQGIHKASNWRILCMHNDVFIWEQGYDTHILLAFQSDPLLAAVGLFGGRGLSIDGGRGLPESNMLGKKYGTHGNAHGNLLTGSHPAVIFDSLAIAIDYGMLMSIDVNLPPHHWTDRLLCLRLLAHGYHLQTLGLAFDHGGSFTAGNGSVHNFAEQWCAENNTPLHPDIGEGTNWDYTLYMYGKKLFEQEFAKFTASKQHKGAFSFWVDENHNLRFF